MFSIQAISQVYNCSKNASINWHSVKFKEFQTFTHAVQILLNNIGEVDNDDYWFGLVKRLRSFRFRAVAAPLSEIILQEQFKELINCLYADKKRFGYSHPDAFENYCNLLTISERLTKINLSQLLFALSNELTQHKRQNQTVVLVCETRFVTDTEKTLSAAGFGKVEVTSPAFLRESASYKNMIVIGPTRWYPDYVFSAPRAQNLLVLKYSWIRDSWKHKNVFTTPLKQKANKLMQTAIDEPFANLSIEPDLLLPPIFNLLQYGKRITDENRGHHEVDYVQARPFLLEEDWVVLLDTDETSSVHVIDLRDSDSSIKKIKVNDVEPGMYVLLRTTGGGDFIVQVADQIMGKDGIAAREHQQKWKSLLRSKVIQHGYEKVVTELRSYGSTRANTSNVRNWMSERSIKTEYRDDFDAIMRLINLGIEANQYWEQMDYIDHAHRKAGHKIRKMLLDKVTRSDLRLLKRTGKMDFELDAENDIRITAFQVKNISPDKISVLPSQLGNPVRQGD